MLRLAYAAIGGALFVTLALAADPPAANATAPVIPQGTDLTEAIRSADGALFGLFFEGCDPEKLRSMVTDDLEFYHDKVGLVTQSGDDFVANYAKNCEGRKAPDAWRSRRALLPESLHVDPVPGFGAMEVGDHVFYERRGDGPEGLAGRARFAMVWQLHGATWKLRRVLSFGHKPAE